MNNLENKIMNIRKGAYTKMEYQSFPCKLKSQTDYHQRVRKVTESVVRLGLEYSHLSENVGKETKGLPYGQWEPTKEKYVISHKGKRYLRLYTSKCSKHKVKVTWYLDDMVVTKEWLFENGYLTESQYKHQSVKDNCFIVELENIISVGK